jgi:Na+/H+-dicarboxylate symporter
MTALRILAAGVLGALAGGLLGERAAPLGELGKLFIQLIKMLAVPLLFLSVVDAFLTTRLKWREAGRMAWISGINTLLALVIGLGLSRAFEPGKSASDLISAGSWAGGNSSPGALEFGKVISGFFPVSIAGPFVDNAMIPVLLLAVLLGAGLRKQLAIQEASGEARGARDLAAIVASLLGVARIVIGWAVAWVPLAVFAVVAKVVGASGVAALKSLPAYIGVALLGLGIQVFVVYSVWIRAVAGRSLREFWQVSQDAVVFALGASSSLATLPVTLRALERLRVAPSSARMSACVATNFNNDGILLYEAMAVLFVAQAHGIELSLSAQLLACLACVVAGFGISGIPDAGLVSLAVVLATVGLPTELLPLLLSVDWILSRARAMTNVVSDMVGGVVLDAWEQKNTHHRGAP